MAITVEKLKGGYEIFCTMDGWCLNFPDGKYKWFISYERLKKYANEKGIAIG